MIFMVSGFFPDGIRIGILVDSVRASGSRALVMSADSIVGLLRKEGETPSAIGNDPMEMRSSSLSSTAPWSDCRTAEPDYLIAIVTCWSELL